MNDTSSNADQIDLRDITDRVEELENELGDIGKVRAVALLKSDDLGEWDDADEDDRELATLYALLDELRGNGGDHKWRGDWYPLSMISDDHFEDYAREFADDVGAVNSDAAWPSSHIDWKAAAEDLQQDYSTIEYEGVTYWYR